METWRDIPDYIGLYEASNQGRIRRKTAAANGAWPAGYVLKPATQPLNGYLHVCLTGHDRELRHQLVHRLVALAFIGPCDKGMQCNHKDGNRSNNHADNLEWMTPSENRLHSTQTLGNKTVRGDRHGNSRVTEIQVIEIRKLYATGQYTHRQLSVMFDITRSSIGSIINRKLWQHVP